MEKTTIKLLDGGGWLEHSGIYTLEYIPDHIIWNDNCYHLVKQYSDELEYQSDGSCLTLA